MTQGGSAFREERVLLIAGHGSRHDDSVTQLLRAQAAAVLARGTFADVVVGALNGAPSIEDVLARHAGRRIVLVPFFASGGYYADEVLGRRVREQQAALDLTITITPPLGAHPAFGGVVLGRARALLMAHGWAANETSVMVIGHGTTRNPKSRLATEAVAAALDGLGARDVHAAFLDEDPTVADCTTMLRGRNLLVLPLLTGGAGHAMQDVPEGLGLRARGPFAAPVLERFTDGDILLDVPMGQWPELAGLIEDAALLVDRAGDALGSVALVGAGPGDPSLITVRGRDLLRRAEVLLYDRLVSPTLLAEVPITCQRIDVGKRPGGPRDAQEEINAQLIAHARAGRRVVRLKGGDPYIYGRGGEELAACVGAGIACEVVPGISSAIAGPAAAGIPVTLRGISRSFAVLTAHEVGNGAYGSLDLSGYSGVDTLVLLMGRSALRYAAAELERAGRAPDLPAACIQHATLPTQRVVRGTLATIADLADASGLESPMVTVVGEVAASDAWLSDSLAASIVQQ